MDRVGTPFGAVVAYEPKTCDQCNGKCGKTVEETDSDGVKRSQWISCSACNGKGER